MRTISARREGRVNVGDEAALLRHRFRAGGCESSPRRAQRSSLGIGGRWLDRNGRGARPETAERLTRLGVTRMFSGRSLRPWGKAGQMRSFAAQAPCGAPGRTSPLSLLPIVVGGLVGVAPVSVAQNPPLPPPSQAQLALQEAVQQNPGLADVIRQRLLQSGLTPEQPRARLQASGYPANLFDAYLSGASAGAALPAGRSEEHTSELQSRLHLVCRLLLEKKK